MSEDLQSAGAGLRDACRELDEVRTVRDEAIKIAVDWGISYARIAALTGISSQRVQQIVSR